jgi:tetratricopeptide (TPR) repeat protein
VSAYALQPELSDVAAAAAARHAGELPEPDRRLLAALLQMLEGEIPLAEQQYREFLRAYPEDAEAWIGLGFIQLILNPWRGRPLSEARASLERAITLQPQYRNALMPLAYVAATEQRFAEYGELIRRVGPDQDFWPVLRALEVFATGSNEEKAAMLAELRETPDVLLYQAARFVALKTNDRAGAVQIARHLTESSRPVEIRATGHVILANLALAQGRRAAAEAELESVERLDPEMALEQRALMALLPFVAVSPERLRAVRAAVARWDPANNAQSAGPRSPFPPHHAVRPQIREYLLGMLSVRLGDDAAALRSITALDARTEGGSVDPLAQDLARYVRAYRAEEQGRLADALALLGSGEFKRPFRYLNFQSPFYANFLERYRHGELLMETGRLEEALPWLAMVAEASPEGLVYSAPSHRLQAMIYERLGEREEAAAHYQRFLELWQDCDPELQEMVLEVRQSLGGG